MDYDPNANNNHTARWRRYGEGFLQVNLGHLLILITMLASAVWWFVIYDREINQTKMVVAQMLENSKQIAARVDAMDNNGTHFSQRNIDKELDTLKVTTDRVTRIE